MDYREEVLTKGQTETMTKGQTGTMVWGEGSWAREGPLDGGGGTEMEDAGRKD